MADIKSVLYDEIRRLARKEVKMAVAPLQAKIAELRKTVAALSKSAPKPKSPAKAAENRAEGGENSAKEKSFRINAEGIKKLRTKLGVSQAQFAKMLGFSTLSVNSWELGKTVPRAAAKARLAQLRSMGKRDLAKIMPAKKRRGRVAAAKSEEKPAEKASEKSE